MSQHSSTTANRQSQIMILSSALNASFGRQAIGIAQRQADCASGAAARTWNELVVYLRMMP
jgi:hypothetical protein